MLSLQFRVGEHVYIEDPRGPGLVTYQVKVAGQISVSQVVVETDDGRVVQLRDDRMTEVYTDVMMGVDNRAQPGMPWLLFEAPKEVIILREKKYVEQRLHRSSGEACLYS